MLFARNVRVPNHRSWRPHPRAKADAVRVGVNIHSPVAKKVDARLAAFPREGRGEIGRR
jgi:hypothetical protein